ncbi:MAG: energy-coupling factor transporter transmembrane component T [Chloroflexota bacterium]|nr:energy-coupling factor transporter transmembrane component T [Chloroflexota bacterium]
MSAPFQYEYHDTQVHKLNPVSKLLLFGAFLLISQFYLDPLTKIPMLVVLVIILAVAKIDIRRYKTFLIAACFAVIVGRSYTAITMLDPELFKVYPQDWASTVILDLTPEGFPIIGRSALTYGTLLYWSTAPFQVLPVILAVAGLLETTSLTEIVSVLSKARIPFPIIFMVTVALKFVPEIVDNINMIQKAQMLRGWTSEGRNPIKKVTQLKPVLVPLIRGVIRSVDVISMGSKNRAFGLGPVTPLADFSFETKDKVISLAVVAITLFLIAASVLWNLGSL